MILEIDFKEAENEIKADFGEIYNISDGGYERGYEKGKADEQAVSVSFIDRTIEGEYYNDKVITVGAHAFYGFSNITSISLPNATAVNASGFANCAKLVNIDLPKLEELPSYNGNAFFQLSNLKVLNLHNCKKINGLQCNQCGKLETVIITTPEVCVTTSSTPFGTTYTAVGKGEGYIYVPDNLVEEYRQSTNWQIYNFKPLSELPEGV